MTTDEVLFRIWARKNWRPGKPIKDTWDEAVKDECSQILQDRKIIVEQEVIHRIFGWCSNQWDALIYLYREIYPCMINPPFGPLSEHPHCNEKTYAYIDKKFRQLDQMYHPHVQPGGLWFKSGWTIDDSLEDWEFWVPAQEHPGYDRPADAVLADRPQGAAVGAALP